MKYKSQLILTILTAVYGVSYAQSGLNKSKNELIAFISRPAYVTHYPEVSIDTNTITTFSKDLKKAVFYSFNSYNRCTGEVMSEKLEDNNYQATLRFLISYLKALNYEPSLDSDNKYIDKRNRVSAIIESNGEWLNIIFKTF
jgi:uncharacterized protein YdhG (YjbR/CyaY superfamily)